MTINRQILFVVLVTVTIVTSSINSVLADTAIPQWKEDVGLSFLIFYEVARIVVPIIIISVIIILLRKHFRRKSTLQDPHIDEKVSITWQTILAAIPLIVTQLIVFSRIDKLKKAIFILIPVYIFSAIMYPILILFPTPSDFRNIPLIIFMLPMILLPSLIPAHFARRWSIEYNKKEK